MLVLRRVGPTLTYPDLSLPIDSQSPHTTPNGNKGEMSMFHIHIISQIKVIVSDNLADLNLQMFGPDLFFPSSAYIFYINSSSRKT